MNLYYSELEIVGPRYGCVVLIFLEIGIFIYFPLIYCHCDFILEFMSTYTYRIIVYIYGILYTLLTLSIRYNRFAISAANIRIRILHCSVSKKYQCRQTLPLKHRIELTTLNFSKFTNSFILLSLLAC